jgi:hypothetical protein
MIANNLIFCKKMMDKAAEKQIGVGYLDPYLFTSTNISHHVSASWQSNLKCNDELLLRGGCLLH